MSFRGFPAEGLALLGRLPTFDKDSFKAHAAGYRRDLQSPLKGFVDALGPALCARISADIQFAPKTHGSIGPINNDVRFNRDAPTYKDHVLLRFWEGEPKKTAPTLYVRLTPTEVGFATGAMFADVDRWREAVVERGAELASALDALLADTQGDLVGAELKRVPRGFDGDHPQADLLRHKWLQVRWPRALPANVHGEDFVDYCADELERATAVHRWLVRELTADGTRR